VKTIISTITSMIVKNGCDGDGQEFEAVLMQSIVQFVKGTNSVTTRRGNTRLSCTSFELLLNKYTVFHSF